LVNGFNTGSGVIPGKKNYTKEKMTKFLNFKQIRTINKCYK